MIESHPPASAAPAHFFAGWSILFQVGFLHDGLDSDTAATFFTLPKIHPIPLECWIKQAKVHSYGIAVQPQSIFLN